MFTFTSNKRRNLVEVAINYSQPNNRNAIDVEIEFLNELTNLMATVMPLHGKEDPTVRPSIINPEGDIYYAHILLKFPIKPLVTGVSGDLENYNYAGLHATLLQLSTICNKYAPNFFEFGTRLNTAAMRSPWVLPIEGHGIILRDGHNQIDYTDAYLPSTVTLGIGKFKVQQITVVGEPRAVKDFDRTWRRKCDMFLDSPVNQAVKRYPNMDVTVLKTFDPIQWAHIGVFAQVEDHDGQEHWVQLGEMHHPMAVDYLRHYGNDMLNTPLSFNTRDGNLFLKEHAYYAFEAVQ